jgi:hypothetical protein
VVEDVKSGFDFELDLEVDAIRHVIQLLMDAGDIPRLVGEDGPRLAAADSAGIRRTYDAFPGLEYEREDAEAWWVRLHDHPVDDDRFLVAVQVQIGAGIPVDAWLSLPRQIDVQALVAEIIAHFEAGADFDPLAVVELVAIQFRQDLPDLSDLQTDVAGVDIEAMREQLAAAILATDEGGGSPLLDFARQQLAPLTYTRVEMVAIRVHGPTALAVGVNLVLLDGAGATIGARGDISQAEPFRDVGEDFALGSRPGLLADLIRDLLFKWVTEQAREPGEEVSETEMLAVGFPLELPTEDLGIPDCVSVRIDRVNVRQAQAADPREQGAPQVGSLRLTVETTDTVLGFLELENNLEIDLIPVGRRAQGVTVPDVYLDTHLSLDVARSLIADSLVDLTLWPLLTPIEIGVVAIVNVFAGEDLVGGTLSSLGADQLSRLPVVTRRWDPFYGTSHQILVERERFAFEAARVFLAGRVHCSTQPVPFERVYPRFIETSDSGRVIAAGYHAEVRDEVIVDRHAYATDRLVTGPHPDPEPFLFRLERDGSENSLEERLRSGRLAPRIRLQPHCIDEDERHIEAIGMLSQREMANLERAARRTWLNARAAELMAEFEAAFGEIEEPQREDAREFFVRIAEGSTEFQDYMENDFDNDVTTALRVPGRVRMFPSPEQLNELERLVAVRLIGYQARWRERTLYYRGIPNLTDDDNLLSLPRCSAFV